MSDVYLLGAGFSHAIHPMMPLTRELTNEVSKYDTTAISDSEIGKLLALDFERAMSYLAENKPWFSENRNLQHRALLAGLIRNIGTVIGKAQATVLPDIAAGKADWALPMINHWQDEKPTIITLNYDLLVEEFLRRVSPSPPQYILGNLYPETVIPATTRGGGGMVSSYHQRSLLRLLKLHGSVNWYRSGNPKNDSDTIYYIDSVSVPTTPTGLPPAIVADKTQFIVAPVPNKASLVYHETVRAMWRDAAEAIKLARNIFILGYSLPANDVLFVQLIKGQLFNNAPKRIVMVNKEPMKDYVNRLFEGESFSVVQNHTGDKAISDFIADRGFVSS